MDLNVRVAFKEVHYAAQPAAAQRILLLLVTAAVLDGLHQVVHALALHHIVQRPHVPGAGL